MDPLIGVGPRVDEDLVGPDKYIKVIVPVAGEDYSAIRFRQGFPLRIRLSSGRVIMSGPPRPLSPGF